METLYIKCADMEALVARLPEWMKVDGSPLPVGLRHVFDWNIGPETGEFLANLRVGDSGDTAEVKAALGDLLIAPPAYPQHVFMDDMGL